MRRKNTILFVVLPVILFAGLLYYLLLMAYRAEQFPEYSAQSTSRLGVNALAESLNELDSVVVRRNFLNLPELNNGTPETVFLIGVVPEQLEETFGRTLTDLLKDRDRVVLGLTPTVPWYDDRGESDLDLIDRSIVVNETDVESSSSALSGVTVDGTIETDDLRHTSKTAGSRLRIPQLPVRSRVKLNLTDDWDTHFELNGDPVLAEHRGYRGDLILVAGSYPFTNHALRDHRVTELLSYCAGTNRQVVFDETHLDIRNQPGIMNLARQYGLTLFLFSLIGLGGLYVWKNSSSLVPSYSPRSWRPEEQAITGQDENAGLLNLIRSRISERQLLEICLDEYKKDVNRGWIRKANLEKAERHLRSASEPGGSENLVDTYREMSRLLHMKESSNDEQC